MTHVKLTKTFTVTGGSDLDAHTDLVMDALLELEACNKGLSDSDMSSALEDGVVEISVVAEGESFDEAVAAADSAIRTAIHAGGGSTPGWVQPVYDPTSSAAELVPA